MKVPILDLHAQYKPIMGDIRDALEQVFASHYYILGPQVRAFEEQVESALDVKHAIGCASGSDALVLALMALGIGEGDEVVTTPFTFFATASAIHRVGARTVFADIDPRTYNLDPAAAAAAITPKTKAIMPVHLFGQPADMDAIMALAAKHGLKVIEDNAQGIGARWGDRYAGTIGDIGTLSFFPSKNLGAMGDGGMCLTQDDELAARLRQLRVHGENPKYIHKWVGLNSRLDALQAAVLSVKLPRLEGWSQARRANADYYREHLADVEQVNLPYIREEAWTIYNQFTLDCRDRDGLMEHLRANDIGCAIYYPLPLHLQECFAYLGYGKGDMPHSERAADRVLSIPIFGELTREQLDHVIATIRDYYGG